MSGGPNGALLAATSGRPDWFRSGLDKSLQPKHLDTVGERPFAQS